MNEMDKFSTLFGSIFTAVGGILITAGVIALCCGAGLFGLIPLGMSLVFGGIGIGFLVAVGRNKAKARDIAKNGIKFTGKIHSYLEDHSVVYNGGYLYNTRVHYFDRNMVEREAILTTKFTRGSSDFPIGATIDIIEYQGKYTWVPGSVRFETISGEAELMDNKPLDPTKINMIAVMCNNCGVSFSAAQGYVAKCPYCGAAHNT